LTQIPSQLISSLEKAPGFDEQLFMSVHQNEDSVTSVRINNAKNETPGSHLPVSKPVPWATNAFYLSERPSFTFDPLFHAGAYYVQEASSMFLEQALLQTVDINSSLTVLDICAAPGGKSTHLLSLISEDSILVSNEVIRSRVNILAENITKWGPANCIVTNNDPKDFSKLINVFDVIVADAPCSGSGLFRKDADAIAEWSEDNVKLCSMRQQRILTDVWPSLKVGGILIYSTCSYSPEEDEDILDWISSSTGAESIDLSLQENWGIISSKSPVHQNKGYRFYPYNLDGEGFFIACFRKPGAYYDDGFKRLNYKPDKKLVALASGWVEKKISLQYYRHEMQLFAMPSTTMELFSFLQDKLNIRKAGVKVGDITRDELIPDHALALSTIKNIDLPYLELNKEQAIAFLSKTDFNAGNIARGWMMVSFNGLSLGWIKGLGNRINNYYPKEWRIRSRQV
jgi:16S rRNA C967 or C1407 C5-methylase (RsmB/RsmF family)/NOL1/NOP2/fmu family ribosome biogenesis protein